MANFSPAPPALPAVPAASMPADAILLSCSGSARQRRLTVAVRLVLAIPHLVALGLLGIAVFVVTVIGWFAALALGRLPAWAAEFLTGWLRWYARVWAYLWLLTDRYPPWATEDSDYPVRMAAAPGRLNRLAVLARIILAIPAYLVGVVLIQGAGNLSLIVIWLIVLINGRMPDSLHQAVAAVLRYQIRWAGYLVMLTGAYPWWGLFGDEPEAVPAAGGTGWEAPAVAPGPVPGPDSAVPPGAAWAPLSPAPAQLSPAAARPPAGAVPWRLVLSQRAKYLVGFFLVLGIVYTAATGIYDAQVLGSSATRAGAVRQVSTAHNRLVVAMSTFQSATASCGGSLTCVTGQETKAAAAFAAFGATLRTTAMPDSASAAANHRVQQDTARLAADFLELSHATSASQYVNELATSGLRQTLASFQTDYRQLGVSLGAVNG